MATAALAILNESFTTAPVLGKDADQSPPLTPADGYCSFSYEKGSSITLSTLERMTRHEAPIISDETVTVTDISISREAVCEMGFPEYLVQVAIDIQRLDHGTDFADAAHLFTAVEDLCQNPQKQADALMRLYQTEQAQKEEANKKHTEVTNQTKENNACYTNECALYPSAEVMRVVEPKQVPETKAQLRERVKKLAQENRKLRQRKLCRGCRKVELASSGVTFLPCGHFITCEICSEKFDDCPACGKSIMGTVRTFLS